MLPLLGVRSSALYACHIRVLRTRELAKMTLAEALCGAYTVGELTGLGSASYAARLARHGLVDAVGAPMAEALKSGSPRLFLRAATTVPLTRIAALIHYKLCLSQRGMGRPIPKRTWDFEYQGGTWTSLDSAEAVAGNMTIVELIDRLWTAPKVLDVGCGTGTLGELLQVVPSLVYTGIDLSDVALSRAKARGLAHAVFAQGALEDWFPTEHYDVIVFNEVIYYVGNPLAVLAKYAHALTERGAFVISIWRAGNYRLLWRAIERAYELVASQVVEAGGVTRDIKVLRKRAENGH